MIKCFSNWFGEGWKRREKEGKKESSKLRRGVLNAYLNNGWIFSNIAVEEKTTSKNSMQKPKQKFEKKNTKPPPEKNSKTNHKFSGENLVRP